MFSLFTNWSPFVQYQSIADRPVMATSRMSYGTWAFGPVRHRAVLYTAGAVVHALCDLIDYLCGRLFGCKELSCRDRSVTERDWSQSLSCGWHRSAAWLYIYSSFVHCYTPETSTRQISNAERNVLAPVAVPNIALYGTVGFNVPLDTL